MALKRKTKGRKNSFKGALIKGMSKKLPSNILEDDTFKQGLPQIMKGYSGIYALYKRNKLYYVGLTTNLHSRVKWHLKDRHARKWDGFKIFRIKRIRYLKDIETLIHNLVDAPGNKVKGKLPKDADLNAVLRRILKEREKATRLIKEALKK